VNALARIDPLLARNKLRAPVELDGLRVIRCTAVCRRSPGNWVDADFEVEGFDDLHVTASTTDGGVTWTTVVNCP